MCRDTFWSRAPPPWRRRRCSSPCATSRSPSRPAGGRFLKAPVWPPCASMRKWQSPVRTARLSVPAGSEKRARGAEEGEPGSPSKRLKIGRQMSLGTVLRHVESQGQAGGSLDSHVGAKPITVEDMTGEGQEERRLEGSSTDGLARSRAADLAAHLLAVHTAHQVGSPAAAWAAGWFYNGTCSQSAQDKQSCVVIWPAADNVACQALVPQHQVPSLLQAWACTAPTAARAWGRQPRRPS